MGGKRDPAAGGRREVPKREMQTISRRGIRKLEFWILPKPSVRREFHIRRGIDRIYAEFKKPRDQLRFSKSKNVQRPSSDLPLNGLNHAFNELDVTRSRHQTSDRKATEGVGGERGGALAGAFFVPGLDTGKKRKACAAATVIECPEGIGDR